MIVDLPKRWVKVNCCRPITLAAPFSMSENKYGPVRRTGKRYRRDLDFDR